MSKLKRNIIQFTYDIEEFIAEIKEEVLKQYKNFIHTIIRIDDKMYINYLLLYYKYIIKKQNFKR